MTEGVYAVILLHATSHAIRAERLLLDAGVRCKLIPVPRQLSSDCGVCVRVARADRMVAERILGDEGLQLDGIHDV